MAQPQPGERLCDLADLADPGSKGFRFRTGEQIFAGFVVRRGEEVRGYVDRCPHAGWPLALSDDFLTRDGRHILCRGHAALFTLEGLCVAGPGTGERLSDWPVTVRDGVVYAA